MAAIDYNSLSALSRFQFVNWRLPFYLNQAYAPSVIKLLIVSSLTPVLFCFTEKLCITKTSLNPLSSSTNCHSAGTAVFIILHLYKFPSRPLGPIRPLRIPMVTRKKVCWIAKLFLIYTSLIVNLIPVLILIKLNIRIQKTFEKLFNWTFRFIAQFKANMWLEPALNGIKINTIGSHSDWSIINASSQ